MFGSVNAADTTVQKSDRDKHHIFGHSAEDAAEAEEGTPLLKSSTQCQGNASENGFFATGSVFSTAVLLIKSSIGAGVLAMAANAAEVGLGFMLFCLVIGAVLVFISLRMIVEASLVTERYCFEDICELLFHAAFAHFTGLVQAMACMGCCVAYLMVGGQIFQVLSGSNDLARHYFIVTVGIGVCLPLSLGRDINFLRHLSMLSVSGLILLLGAVLYVLIQSGPDKSITSSTLWNGKGEATFFSYVSCFSIVTFAYSVVSIMPQITGEVTDRNDTRSTVSMSLACFTAYVLVFYSFVATVGLLAFGVGENQLDTLILDLAPHKQLTVVYLAFAAVISSVFMCFLFNIYPIRQFLGYQIRLAFGHSANHDEKSERMMLGISETRFYDIWSAVGSVLMAVVLAVMFESLRMWLELVGAFACSYLAFIVPSMWMMRIRSKQGRLHCLSPEIILYMAIFCGGVCLSLFGTYAALVPK